MSGHQLWLLAQSKEFQAGYDAQTAGAKRNSSCAEWLRGFDQASDDETRSELQRFA